MRAKISMQLERPTREGRTVKVPTIMAKESQIVGAVDEFIFDRMNKPEGWVKVKKFIVDIDNPITGRQMAHWGGYVPTYR